MRVQRYKKKSFAYIVECCILAFDYPCGERADDIIVVRRHDDGRPLPANVVQELDNLAARLRVEVPRRFVGQDEGGIVQQGPCDADALLFATRKLVGHLVAFRLHIDLRQDFIDAGVDFVLLPPAGGLEDEGEVVIDRAVGQELEILEHDAQAPAKVGDLLPLDAPQVEVEQACLARADGDFAIEGFQEAAFPRPDFPDDVNKLSVLHGEACVVKNRVFFAADINVR